MNQYVKRTQRDYPLSFKLAVVAQVEKGEMTYRQAQTATRLMHDYYKPRTAGLSIIFLRTREDIFPLFLY